MRILCTIHNIKFGAEPAEGCSEENKAAANMVECPACIKNKINALHSALGTVMYQRDCLIKAIELKQEFLAVRVTE